MFVVEMRKQVFAIAHQVEYRKSMINDDDMK